MDEIENLLPTPHNATDVKCMKCGKQWTAIYPVATPVRLLECPNSCEQGWTITMEDFIKHYLSDILP